MGTLTEGPVSRCLDALQDDFERQSCHLTWDDVHQTVLARSLEAVEAAEVWEQAAARFRLPCLTDDLAATQAGDVEALITQAEERTLTRRVAAARLLAGGLKQFSPASEVTWFVLQTGKQAFDRLILANTGLIGSIVNRFVERAKRLDRDDLFQEGVLGLIRGIEKFDPDRGYRLTTYASGWIEQHVRRAIDNRDRTIRLPCHTLNTLRQMIKRRARLRNQLDRPPTASEIAKDLGVEEGLINLLIRVEQDAVGLEEVAYERGEMAGVLGGRSRVRSPLSEPEQAELITLVQKGLAHLDRRARFILAQRFGLDGRSKYTLQTLGDRLKITRERVRQIEAKSLGRLSRGREGKALRAYVEE